MQVHCRHIAANCNPKPNSVLFLNPQTIAFTFSNQIGIYQVSTNKVTLNLHDTEVKHNRANCLFALSQQSKTVLFCGYDSGYLLGYFLENGQWTKKITIKGDIGIISIQGIQYDNQWHIFINNNNSVLCYYKFQQNQLTLVEQITFHLNKLIESICLSIKEQKLMLFVGGVDQKIHYYQKQLKEQKNTLQYRFSLSGHQNAITKLIITKESNSNDLLLASASKDGYIRLWRITDNLQSIKFHKNVYSILSASKIFLEAVLVNHQCSVTGLCWTNFGNKLQLASSSLDCTLCLWGNGSQEGAWTVDSRMGQFIGNKNAYFDVLTDPANKYLIALNYTGALLMWKWQQGKFTLRECFNGHSNQVKDIEWNHSGDYLVSVSKDQTTRVIAKNINTNNYNQISRAQIHGYDINAVTVLKIKQGTLDVIACGADQKVIRILQPPACFANYLNTFTHANLHLFFDSEAEQNKYKVSKPQDQVLLYEAYSEGGTQVLGLMTKAQRVQKQKITNYYQEEEGVQEIIDQNIVAVDIKTVKLDYRIPPHDDYLVKHTLWPQLNKLYGHGHELQVLCRSRASKRMASACSALNQQSASIIVWNTNDWKIAKILSFHNYTVFGIQFSFNDQFFASVSKDRRLAVYDNNLQLLFNYQAHTRAITSLSFHLSEEYILTGSRDKTIKLHSTKQQKIIKQFNVKQPVSAIAFCLKQGYQNYFAVGCVNGVILIGLLAGEELSIITQVDDLSAHTESINAIKWNGTLFAICSNDFSVKIFEIESK